MKTLPHPKDPYDIIKIVELTGLKEDNWLPHPEGSKIPIWFYLLFSRYEQKEEIIAVMDHFGVPYPKNIRDIKAPSDYSERELDALFANKIASGKKGKMEYGYSDDFKPWHKAFERNGYDAEKTLSEKLKYDEFPWTIVVKNPLLKEEKYFEKILSLIKSNPENYHHFAHVCALQDVSEEQFNRMAELNPYNRFYKGIYIAGIERGFKKAQMIFAENETSYYAVSEMMNKLCEEAKVIAIHNTKEDDKKLWLLRFANLSDEANAEIVAAML